MVDDAAIRATALACTDFFREQADRDWGTISPAVGMSIAEIVAHVADGCLWYAIDLAAGGLDLQAAEHGVKANAANGDLIDVLATYSTLVGSVVASAPSSARGFHPMGTADGSGFAAMACDEMLIHTNDAAVGLGVDFHPRPELADQVLRRLFPWVESSADPWSDLLWANGRIAHAGREQLKDWAWHCAPLEEWDGEVAKRPGPRTST